MSFAEKNEAYKEKLQMGCGSCFIIFIECQKSPIDNVIFEQKLRGSDGVNHMDQQGEQSAAFSFWFYVKSKSAKATQAALSGRIIF